MALSVWDRSENIANSKVPSQKFAFSNGDLQLQLQAFFLLELLSLGGKEARESAQELLYNRHDLKRAQTH